MLIVGLILLVVAIGVGWFARRARAHVQQSGEAQSFTCAELTERAATAGQGSFRQHGKVVGRAAHPEDQGIEAPESGLPAVWHRTQVTRRYWEMERRDRDGKTEWDRVERTETVSDLASEVTFALEDDSGRVLVAPVGAKIDRPEQVVDRFERSGDAGGDGVAGAIGGALTTALQRSGERSGTIGFQTKEWVIRPGAQLYVLGEVADRTGTLCFGKPERGHFVVSTRSEEELVGSYRRNAMILTAIAAASAIAGVACVGIGIAG